MKIIAKLEHTPTSPESKMCQVPLCKNKNQEEGLAATAAAFNFKEDETDCDLDFSYRASRLSKFLSISGRLSI